jgi:hypothetical protein
MLSGPLSCGPILRCSYEGSPKQASPKYGKFVSARLVAPHPNAADVVERFAAFSCPWMMGTDPTGLRGARSPATMSLFRSGVGYRPTGSPDGNHLLCGERRSRSSAG